MKRISISILGSTGSIGVNTLDVLARHPQRFEVFALSAASNAQRLLEQCLTYRPRYAVLRSEEAAARLQVQLRQAGATTVVLCGIAGLERIAVDPQVDCVMAAIVGAAGLVPSLAAAAAGKRILLANKEALVMSGSLFMHTAQAHGATLIPVDSEHNALFQLLEGMPREQVLALGNPSWRITMFLDGHLVERFSYRANGERFGLVELSDGSVKHVETN